MAAKRSQSLAKISKIVDKFSRMVAKVLEWQLVQM